MLKCDIDSSTFVAHEIHFCEKCSYLLSEKQCKVFGSLPQLEETLFYAMKSTMVYFGNYVIEKMNQMQMTPLIMMNGLGDSFAFWTERVWIFLGVVFVNGYVSTTLSFNQL